MLLGFGATERLDKWFGIIAKNYEIKIEQYENKLENEYSDDKRAQLVDKINSDTAYTKSYYENSLKKFDETKPQIIAGHKKAKEKYERIIRTLMDFVVGYDFAPEDENSDSIRYGLKFLSGMNVAGINFVGISVGGHPVTREMLKEEGLEGWENAIITITDLDNLPDEVRRDRIKQQVSAQTETKGQLIYDNIYNFVPIWRAAEIGDVEVLNVRLAANGNPNEQHSNISGEKAPAIVWAAKNNQEAIIDILCAHPLFDINTLPAAILAAAKAGHALLKIKLSEMQNVDELDKNGNSLLHYAIKRGDVAEVTRLVITKHANVNLKGQLGYPLHIAAEYSNDKSSWFAKPSKNHIDIIRILIANGADADVMQRNYNALRLAADAGSFEAVDILLPVTKKNPVVETSYRDGTEITSPWFLDLMYSSYGSREWINILTLLKNNGADLSLPSTEGDTLLHLAMRNFPSIDSMRVGPFSKKQRKSLQDNRRNFMTHLHLLNFLLDSNVNISLCSKGDNALHCLLKKNDLSSIVGGFARIIDLFLGSDGFDIDAKNSQGRTLLHIAAIKGNTSAVKYLISRGADLNAQDSEGNTPLHYSLGGDWITTHAYPSITACLVQAGARTHIKNGSGLSPRRYSSWVKDKFVATKTFKSWRKEVRQEVLNDFKEARNNLSLLVALPNNRDFNDPRLQKYINKCREEHISKYIVADISPKDQLLLGLYRDEVSQQIMQVPVVLNERVYDLDTLIALHQEGKPDPFTHKPFDLSDIEPAEMMALEIKLLITHLRAVYPQTSDVVTKDLQSPEQPLVPAPGVNGIFGRSSQTLQKPSSEEKSEFTMDFFNNW